MCKKSRCTCRVVVFSSHRPFKWIAVKRTWYQTGLKIRNKGRMCAEEEAHFPSSHWNHGSFTGGYSHKKRNLLILRNKNFFHLFFLNNPACFSTGTLTFKGKTFDEKLCCPFPHANCCEHNRCCRQQYKVCCPPPPAVPTYCCPADYPVCKDGQCSRARDGHMVSGEPAVGVSPLE